MISEDFSHSLAIGAAAPEFVLKDCDGAPCQLDDFAQDRFLVLHFTCNHCPYVLGSDDRLSRLIADFAGEQIGWLGICSNDAERFPQDSLTRMRERAPSLPYRYAQDPSQNVAKAYGAQVTPEFFLLERNASDWILRWHGTIDDSPRSAAAMTLEYLKPALTSLLTGEALATTTTPVHGCSIKWRPGGEPNWA